MGTIQRQAAEARERLQRVYDRPADAVDFAFLSRYKQ